MGVFMEAALLFKKQATSAVKKASQAMAVVQRLFRQLDTTMFPLLFKTLARSHLEYGNLVRGPFNPSDQKLVECMLRRATKLVPKVRYWPYQERLQALKLPSLYHHQGVET